MKSKRIISYIGLWALVMPWLGFSWDTKTVLFSLTGLLLLYIGNKHYGEAKNIHKKTHIDNSPKVTSSTEPINNHIYTEPEIILDTYKNETQLSNVSSSNESSFASFNSEIVNSIPKEEPVLVQEKIERINIYSEEDKPKVIKPKRKLEIVSQRPKKTIKAISFDSLENSNE